MARFTQSAQSMLIWATSHVLDEGYTGGTVWQMITTTSVGLGLSECKCSVYTINETWLILGGLSFMSAFIMSNLISSVPCEKNG